MPELEEAVGSVLQALGDGNWKMGDGKRVGKGQKPGTVDVTQRVLIQHYVCMSMHSFSLQFLKASQMISLLPLFTASLRYLEHNVVVHLALFSY